MVWVSIMKYLISKNAAPAYSHEQIKIYRKLSKCAVGDVVGDVVGVDDDCGVNRCNCLRIGVLGKENQRFQEEAGLMMAQEWHSRLLQVGRSQGWPSGNCRLG